MATSADGRLGGCGCRGLRDPPLDGDREHIRQTAFFRRPSTWGISMGWGKCTTRSGKLALICEYTVGSQPIASKCVVYSMGKCRDLQNQCARSGPGVVSTAMRGPTKNRVTSLGAD